METLLNIVRVDHEDGVKLCLRTAASNGLGRIKGFVGPKHFTSLGPFGDWENYFWNYGVLSIIRDNGGGGNARITEKHELSELYILYADRSFR
jgi:hypothetical protein